MQVSNAKNKHYGVVGLGKTGLSTISALVQSGAHVFAWDDDVKKRDALAQAALTCKLTKPESWPWENLAALVLSPGIPLYHPQPHPLVTLAKTHNVPVIGDIELLQQARADANYIGITGTNGKSTVTSLIGHVFDALKQPSAVGGNLGQAVMQLPELNADETYVLELSSYQLDLCDKAHFGVAVWLNISPDHLDRHGDLAGYVDAKKRIFNHQKTGDTAVIGVDDVHSQAVYAQLCANQRSHANHDVQVVAISVTQQLENGIFVKNGVLHDKVFANRTFDLNEVPTLQGEHNHQNAAAAYAACVASGLDAHATIEAMRHYPGLAHRMQWLGEWQNIGFVNDSKATNADATAKALATYDSIYWIAGGVAKAGGIDSLAPYFSKIKKAYLIGESANDFAEILALKNIAHAHCGTMESAVKQAAQDAFENSEKNNRTAPEKPAVILLSPAAASFDQYANFEARGEDFISQVNAFRTVGEAAC